MKGKLPKLVEKSTFFWIDVFWPIDVQSTFLLPIRSKVSKVSKGPEVSEVSEVEGKSHLVPVKAVAIERLGSVFLSLNFNFRIVRIVILKDFYLGTKWSFLTAMLLQAVRQKSCTGISVQLSQTIFLQKVSGSFLAIFPVLDLDKKRHG